MSTLPPPPPGFNVDPPPSGFRLDRPTAAATPPPPPGFVPEQTGVPANFTPPTQGGEIDARLLGLARSMPDTRFDFSEYGQVDPAGGRAQLPTLTPEQEAAASRRAGLPTGDELQRLTGRVLPIVNDARNPVGRAADQLLIEDANVTPIEAAGGYDAYGQQLRQQAYDRMPRFVRPIASGLNQSTFSSVALLGQVTDALGATEGLADAANKEVVDQSGARKALGTTTFENAAEGVTRSLVDLVTVGRLVPAGGRGATGPVARLAQARGPIVAFTAKAMNDAEYRGSQAGLSGQDLAEYILLQGTIEGGVTAAFSMVGLGGFENLKGAASAGLRDTFKQLGVQTLGELGEENIIGVLGAVTDATTGVDPEATSPEQMRALIAETSLATLMTMGVAEGGGRAVSWSRGRTQQQTAQDPLAEPERGTRSFLASVQDTATGRSLTDVASIAAQADPDVQQDGETRGMTADFFAAQARETLENANDAYVLVDLPLDRVDVNESYQAEQEQAYADQPADTAPPAMGGVQKGSTRFVLVDGNTRARAARRRGEATIKAYVPRTDAQALQPLALPSPMDTARQRATEARAALGDAQATLASEQAALAQQPPGEGVISVDPAGRATTPAQQAEIDQITQAITQPQTDPSRLLPGQQARFVVDEQGQAQDLQPAQQSPQAPESKRRSQRTTDAVTEEADALINSLRKTGELSDADEARVRQLVGEARRNPLTGGMNRRAFERVFDAVRQRARKTGKPVSVIAFDAANLKTYNDKISESAGDAYLRRVQRVIEQSLRGSDDGRDRIGDAFHYGGDEWAVILPDTDEAGARRVRDRIEQAFGREEIVPGVSAFLVGESVTVNPNSRKKLRATLDDAAKGMKERKTEKKRAAGEATTREEAEARAAQAATPTPAPVFKRASAGVKDAAAAVARAKREVERTEAVVEQLKAEQEANANEPGSFDPNDPDAVAEALLPPGAPRVVKQSVVRQWLSRKITPMGYTIERWAPRLYTRLKQFERHWRSDRHDADRLVHKFEQFFKGKREAREQVLYLLQTGQHSEARQYINENLSDDAAAINEALDDVITAKDAWHWQFKKAGGKVGTMEHHFPRSVRSDKFDEFMVNRHGPEATDELFTAIRRESKKKGRPLTVNEKVEVANRLFINGRPPVRPGSTSPKALGARTVEDLDFDTWKEFYDTGFDAVYGYFDTVIYNTHKARLFGKDTADATIDETIGRMFVEGKYGLDKLTPYQKNRMRSIITARFTGGEAGSGAFGRGLRDLGYMTILGDPVATAIQFADVAQSAVRDGVLNTLVSIPIAIRENHLTAKNLGLDHISDTYGDVNWLSKVLRQTLTYAGFRAVDNSFLTVSMVSAKRKAQKQIKTPKAEQKFRAKWGVYYPQDQLDALVRDLKANTPSDLVADYAYMRASETRPMDHFDAPESYVANPRLRILWQMKQFAIKQFSLIRRQGWDKVARGIQTNNGQLTADGVGGLVRAMMLLGLAGASADWIRDWLWDRTPDFSDSLVNSLLYTHLGSTYLFNNAADEGPGSTAWNMVAPPVLSQVDDVWTSAVDGKQKWWRVLPLVGDTVYSFTEENAGKNVRKMRQEALDNAREAHLRGDFAGRDTYVRMFNNRMKDLGREDRLSTMSVRSSAKRQEDKAKEEGAAPWGTTRTLP